MTALRHVVKRAVHKERSQLASRSKLGLLEKKKDYVIRAKENHRREDYINNLKKKAFLKNPDEFYFKMAGKKVREDGKVELGGSLSKEQKALARDQDLAYVAHRRQIDLSAARKLGGYTPVDDAKSPVHVVFAEDSEDEKKAIIGDRMILKGESLRKAKALSSRADKLTEVMNVLQTKKDLGSEPRRKKVKELDKDGGVRYKWEQQRKR